jgi:DNA processing protein
VVGLLKPPDAEPVGGPPLEVDEHDLVEERVALLRLMGIPRVGPWRLWKAVQAVGSGRALLEASPFERGALLRVRSGDPAPPAEARALLARCEAAGVRALSWIEPAYPPLLRHLDDPPPLLYVMGDPARLHDVQVAIVGSRRASGYGRRAARALAGDLARAGITVLSGMALGVDGEAHVGALDAGGASTGVLASGPERAYPRRHQRLHRRLVERGAVASEQPPGTPALGHHFPARNRLLAALALGVVVVEAAEKSGALLTVNHALALGREVLAVPGPIDAPTSQGVNGLFRDGSKPAVDAGSVLKALHLLAPPEPATPCADPPVELGADAGAVWRALGSAPLAVDALARDAGLRAPRALAALVRLELEGWAVQEAGLRFRRRRA